MAENFCKTFIHRFDSDRRLQSTQQITGSSINHRKVCARKRSGAPSRPYWVVICLPRTSHEFPAVACQKNVAEIVATTCLDGVIWSSRVREISLYLLLHVIQCNCMFKPLWDYESAAPQQFENAATFDSNPDSRQQTTRQYSTDKLAHGLRIY